LYRGRDEKKGKKILEKVVQSVILGYFMSLWRMVVLQFCRHFCSVAGRMNVKGERTMQEFRERLAAILAELHMTQKVLAERIGITEASLSRYLNEGRIPHATVIANMATALGTTTDYLLGVSGERDLEFPQIQRLLARNANKISPEDRRKLMHLLIDLEK
jgi:transcriptional regulator with XRE-family HTH domain